VTPSAASNAPAPARETNRRHRAVAAENARLMSLDALRGFDMFWIAGGGLVVSALDRWTGNPVLEFLKGQLTHVAWAGFHFYDLIFPLFVFMVGASIAFSIRKSVAKHGRWLTVRKIVVRGVILFLIGIFYSGGLSTEWPDIRVLGVLNRIAICYTVTALLFVFLRLRWLVPIWLGLLLGYWAALALIPIRDIELAPQPLAKLAAKKGQTNVVQLFNATQDRIRGKFEPGYNLANHFDFQHLPGRRYDVYYDPEGLLSTLPAIASCLLGVFAGLWQQSAKYSPTVRSVGLIVAGFLAMSAGYMWGFQFPVVKKLWTSSFVLVAGGYSLMLLGLFHQIIDVWGWRKWCQPLVWIGSNALTIYLAAQILNFRRIAERIAGGPVKSMFGVAGDTLVALVAVGLLFWFARFLYRRQIFLRV
jgi:predicted acyltransferase